MAAVQATLMPSKVKSAWNPKVPSALQPSPRTAYEGENRVSGGGSKEISGNFEVTGFPLLFRVDWGGFCCTSQTKVSQKWQMIGRNQRQTRAYELEMHQFQCIVVVD